MLEPPGARPVIVEDDAFVGAGSGLFEGVLVGRGAAIGAGVILTGTSRLYDLVRETVLVGTRGRAARRSGRGASSCPARASSPGSFARTHGLSVTTAVIVKDRDAGTDARTALEAALR